MNSPVSASDLTRLLWLWSARVG